MLHLLPTLNKVGHKKLNVDEKPQKAKISLKEILKVTWMTSKILAKAITLLEKICCRSTTRAKYLKENKHTSPRRLRSHLGRALKNY